MLTLAIVGASLIAVGVLLLIAAHLSKRASKPTPEPRHRKRRSPYDPIHYTPRRERWLTGNDDKDSNNDDQ